MSSTNIKTFNKVIDMIADTTLTAGNICETLGYHEAGDGGGARYTVVVPEDGEVANGGSVITLAATGANNESLVARFMDEGKPVNVLQFGARNYYSYLNSNEIPTNRNDSIPIQLAIDYTNDRLDDNSGSGYHNNINTIILPAGNYVICDQIEMPPYMQVHLEGDVQFYSFVTAGDVTLYKYDAEGKKMVEIDEGEVGLNGTDDVYSEREVFAKYNVNVGNYNLKVKNNNNEEYFVYKKGIFKICYKFNPDGTRHDPYGGRYSIHAMFNTEIFTGNGSLNIQNKIVKSSTNSKGKKVSIAPCYICGIEVGNTEEFIRAKGSASYVDEEGNEHKYSFVGEEEHLKYSCLRFTNLKFAYCNVGILSHGCCFYSNVIRNCEFFQNTVAFQFGIYGEDENVNSTEEIVGEISIDSAEMNHFRDCVFTGNKIDINILLSGAILNFNSCHFDFDNCVFRASYRTRITVTNCHIEGIGNEIRAKYFPEGYPFAHYVTAFKNRATNNYIDEFVGIMYAKPIRKFTTGDSGPKGFVNLNITSSLIIDYNADMPWPLFSFYNSDTSALSNEHSSSNLVLENNTYSITNNKPNCYYTTIDDGIVQSGFLVSEVYDPVDDSEENDNQSGNQTNNETTEQDDEWDELFVEKNVNVVSKGTNKWASFIESPTSPQMHRFLSNRTLALKYPYFQNLKMEGDKINGIKINDKFKEESEIILNIDDNSSPFKKYDERAKMLDFKDILINASTEEEISRAKEKTPHFIIDFVDDVMYCKKDDIISAALVTSIPSFNTYLDTSDSTNQILIDEVNTHKIKIVEYDSNDNFIGEYVYDMPYIIGDSANNFSFQCTSTATCRHIVKNCNTAKIKFSIDFYSAVIAYPNATDYPSCTSLYALLAEKNK